MTVLAGVDCGTNSIRLLIRDGSTRLVERAIVTRLGLGVHASKHLSRQSVEKTLQVLAEYRSEIDKFDVSSVRAVATSATRDANNGAEFLELASAALGAPVELISGDLEAQLTFAGAASMSNLTRHTTVVDIGGGSTEVVVGNSDGPVAAHSFDVGSVRLTELFLPGDPPSPEAFEELVNHVRSLVANHAVSTTSRDLNAQMIAVGGTATSLSAIDSGIRRFSFDAVHDTSLRSRSIERMAQKFLTMTSARRADETGLDPGRADVIVAGAGILMAVMSAVDANDCRISAMDLLDGLTVS